MQVANLTDRHRPATLDQIVGQGYVTHDLADYAAAPYSHAFLFDGPTGIGKTTAAMALARELGADDVASLWHVQSGEQDGDQMDLLRRELRFAPMGRFRVVIVEECDWMARAPKVANLWLSMIEDLPPRTLFIFTTNHPEKLAARFVDRCERLTFASEAPALLQDARLLAARIWHAEGGRPDRLPDVASLPGVVDDSGRLSFRRVVRAVESLLRGTRDDRQAFGLIAGSALPRDLFNAAIRRASTSRDAAGMLQCMTTQQTPPPPGATDDPVQPRAARDAERADDDPADFGPETDAGRTGQGVRAGDGAGAGDRRRDASGPGLLHPALGRGEAGPRPAPGAGQAPEAAPQVVIPPARRRARSTGGVRFII